MSEQTTDQREEIINQLCAIRDFYDFDFNEAYKDAFLIPDFACLPEKERNQLVMVALGRAKQEHKAKKAAARRKPPDQPAPEAVPVEGDGLPELLPFSKLPGYLLDPWGVPHRQKSERRKEGKVVPENYFYKKPGCAVPQHIARYRLTVDGERKTYYPRYLFRARLHAESEWKAAQKPVDHSNLQTAHS